MPSMLVQVARAARTSMLLRIAHAARTTAEATSRFACLAERAALSPEAVVAASQAPGRAGGGDLLLHRFAAAPPPDALAAPSPAVDAGFPPHYLRGSRNRKHKDRVEFVVQEDDLKSDEALWALYERWCKAFNQKRDQDEMQSCFNEFKDNVLRQTNYTNLPFKLGKYTDGKLMKMCANPNGDEAIEAEKAGSSCVIWKTDGSFLREVYADFNVVDGKLFVFLPPMGEKVELTTNYEVMGGRLFADLPEGNKLVIPNEDFIARRRPYYPCFYGVA